MTKSDVLKIMKKAKNVALFAHKNPDPDAYGAMFAMREALASFGAHADVFAIRNEKSNLDLIFPLDEVKTKFNAEEYDLCIMLDIFALKRINPEFVDGLQNSEKILIIDHHHVGSDEKVASENFFIEPEKSATCEILTDLFTEFKIEITPKMATYLWAGLIGDTDRFLHNNLSKNVLKTACALFEHGADAQFVYDALFRSVSMRQLGLNKAFINKLKFLEDGKVGYVIFTTKDLKKLDIDRDNLYTLYAEIVKIQGVEASFFISQIDEKHFKVSVRTKGLDSLKVSHKMGGGGHTCASAFECNMRLPEIKRAVHSWAKTIIEK